MAGFEQLSGIATPLMYEATLILTGVSGGRVVDSGLYQTYTKRFKKACMHKVNSFLFAAKPEKQARLAKTGLRCSALRWPRWCWQAAAANLWEHIDFFSLQASAIT